MKSHERIQLIFDFLKTLWQSLVDTLNVEDYKVLLAAWTGILISFLTPQNLVFARYLVIAVTIGYQLHKWYIMFDDRRKSKDGKE